MELTYEAVLLAVVCCRKQVRHPDNMAVRNRPCPSDSLSGNSGGGITRPSEKSSLYALIYLCGMGSVRRLIEAFSLKGFALDPFVFVQGLS